MTAGVIVLILLCGLAGAWIGSRRPSLGTPAGFVLGVFAILPVLTIGAIILRLGS